MLVAFVVMAEQLKIVSQQIKLSQHKETVLITLIMLVKFQGLEAP
jgi:hypothetical protein